MSLGVLLAVEASAVAAVLLTVGGRMWGRATACLLALFYVVFAAIHAFGAPNELPSGIQQAGWVLADVALIWGLASVRRRELLSPPARRGLLAANWGVAVVLSLLLVTYPVLPLPRPEQQLMAFLLLFWLHWLATAAVLGRWTSVVPLLCFLVLPFEPGAASLLNAAGLGLVVPALRPRAARTVRVLALGGSAVFVAVVAHNGIAAAGASGRHLSEPGPVQLALAAFYALMALVWGIAARQGWPLVRTRHEGSLLPRLVTLNAAGQSAMNALCAVFFLLPEELVTAPPEGVQLLRTVGGWLSNAAVAIGGHASLLLRTRGEVPRPAWIVINYAPAVGFSLFVFLFGLGVFEHPDRVIPGFVVAQQVYWTLGLVIAVGRVARAVRRDRWWWTGVDITATAADVVLFTVVVFGMATWTALLALRGLDGMAASPQLSLAIAATTLLPLVVPFAMRSLGEVVRVVTTVVAACVATGTILVAARAASPLFAAAGVERFGTGLTVAGLVAVLLAARPRLALVLDRVVFRRTLRRGENIRRFLQALPPEAGALTCAERTLDELARATNCAAGAIMLQTGEVATTGDLDATLVRGWAAELEGRTLPARVLAGVDLFALPSVLRETLVAGGVTVLVQLVSPRRRWGHVVLRMRLLGIPFRDEELNALEAFADQLALVLDATELVARAAAVERSLAHAEKLAAIGDVTARIVHEIRNPVTAARSLAQQLARDASAPDAELHGLILTELERVERQVAALLRFARRDEFRVEAVDLGALARATVDFCRARFEADHIAVGLEAADGVVVAGDPDKIRQVLLNLLDNAIDALHESPERRLDVTVQNGDGSAMLAVQDSGPGVSAAALSSIFAPFYTTKSHGTGLGLAIARRTVEAFGGRITAERPTAGGLLFHVELPLAAA